MKKEALMSHREPRILCWDVETSLMLLYAFSLFNERMSHTSILQDWFIICGAYKWLGEKEIHTIVANGRNDKSAVKKLRDVVASADIIIHHNGDKFDLKKLNARMAFWGIAPFPPPKTVDTLKVARKEFKFTSNRLDYIGKYLGVGGKIKAGENLWTKVLEGDKDALRKMVEYNKRDVDLLEKVYLKLRPYIRNHPNLNLFNDKEVCPNCESGNLSKRGYSITRTTKYQRFQCKDCGAWSQKKPNLESVKVC